MKALTIGGAMVDTIAIIENAGIERMTMLNAGTSFLLLEEGGKTEALEVSTHAGGGGINAAIAFARLGLDTSVLIKLGADGRAELIIAALDRDDISHRWALRDPRAPTGASVHVSSHDRNAAVFTFRGANTLLVPDDLADEAFAVDLVYIANLSDQAARCFPIIVEKAQKARALIAVNPGIRQLHAHAGAFQGTLPALDVLSLNRREADEVVSMLERDETKDAAPLAFPEGMAPPALAVRGLRHEGRKVPLTAFMRALLGRGVGTILVTDGQNGAFAASRGGLYHCPAREVTVLGTAGAGDAFASTFTAETAIGSAPDRALQAATLNAAAVLGHVDTTTGLMARREIEAALDGKIGTPNVISWRL
ncbi:carbohydrate kinase [Hyphomicrobium nitrativorans NL23]|uniref:Carbohydrate kinase n=1 Tax=Hyphomicrobium nitrativorans NL23 TaxID=1029756 RepID=V5SEP6_9HYPH|nr:carbohydrate kinase family protein [Hyphomicrobium nitrativorans]AHB49331.1 carbohydrate kinase [Hyphomicrobium nitrativorans NL23]